jgi:hypothetical protein
MVHNTLIPLLYPERNFSIVTSTKLKGLPEYIVTQMEEGNSCLSCMSAMNIHVSV